MVTADEVTRTLDRFVARMKTIRFLQKNLIGEGGLSSEAPLALLIDAIVQDAQPVCDAVVVLRDRIPAAEYDRDDAQKLGAWLQKNLQHHAGKSWSEAIAAEVTGLLAKIEQLECRPLVLCVQRETHVAALVEAQVCDRAEAERRAVARYPKGAKTNG